MQKQKQCGINQKQTKMFDNKEGQEVKMIFSCKALIDFVTWPPLQINNDSIQKGGQVTKLIIVLKMHPEKNIILTS